MARVSKAELASEIKSSPVLSKLMQNNIALTRETFLSMAYLGNPPELLSVEDKAELPTFLQDWRLRHAD